MMTTNNRVTLSHCIKTLPSAVGGIVLGCTLVISSVFADDTEVFFSQAAATGGTNPNVLLVIDTSVSMDEKDGGTVTRLDRVKEAVRDIIDQSENINIGLMRFNGRDSGGAVIYPVRNIDERLCTDGSCSNPVATSRIRRAEADAVENIASSVVAVDDLSLNLGAPASGDTIVGMHFDNLRIPQGAIVLAAELVVVSSDDDTSTSTIDVRAEQVDDATIFTDTNSDLSNRTTGTTQSYLAPSWTDGEFIVASGLEAVVQQVVNRPGWCGGNAINLLAEGEGVRSFHSYEAVIASGGSEDDDASTSGSGIITPELRVTYTLAGMPETGGCMLATTVAQVSSSADDSSQFMGSGNLYPNSWSLYPPFEANWGETAVGMRFPNLDIPQGSEIVSANIDLTVRYDRVGTVDLRIYGEAIDDAPQFFGGSGNKFNISNRTNTTTIVPWLNVPEAAQNTIVTTPDLSASLQEIVNRAGWNQGNAAAFIIRNNGTVSDPDEPLEDRREYYSYDGSSTKAAKLIVNYKAKVDASSASGGKVRDELLAVLDNIQAADRTPTTDTFYEAVNYYLGRPVEMGWERGDDPRRGKHRVSHPDSYTGGTLYTPPGCTAANFNSEACKNETITGGAVYISPIESECQANHIVLLADGDADWHTQNDEIKNNILNVYESDFGTKKEYDEYCDLSYGNTQSCGRELARHIATEDLIPSLPGDQTISTYTIGFAKNVDYLKDLAAEGNGSYFEADSSIALLAAFKSIFASIQAIDTSFVAPATSVNAFNRLANSEDLYFALFKPAQGPIWNGNLKKYKIRSVNDEITIVDARGDKAIDPDTGLFEAGAKSFWSSKTDGNVVKFGGFAGQLGDRSSARRVFTYVGDYEDIPTAGENLTATVNAVHEDNADVTKTLLNIASLPGTATEQAAYRNLLLKWMRGLDPLDDNGDGSTTDLRDHMGDPMHSNPLMLNYQQTATTSESTVFVGTNEGYIHAIDTENGEERYAFIPKELLENGVKFFDNQGSTNHPYGMDGPLTSWFNDLDEDFLIDTNEKAYLYAGMRRGGSNYYALDVSNRNNPKLKWAIEGGYVTDLGDFTEMGQSWSAATPHNILIGDVVTKVLIFGAGYDTNADPSSSGIMSRTKDGRGRGFYVVDAETGERLYAVLGGATGDQTHKRLEYSVPSNIRGVDTDNDGLTDQLYFGDMGGQLWRWDFRKDYDPGTQNSLFTGGRIGVFSSSKNPANHRRFYNEPDVSIVNVDGIRKLAISIGSGWRAHPLNTEVNDRFFVLFSDDILSAPDTYTLMRQTDLTNITNVMNRPVGANGWRINLNGDGEKVLSSSVTANNQLIFTVYEPEDSGNACEAAVGGGSAYVVDIRSGKPLKDVNNDGTIDKEDRKVELSLPGIPPPANVVITDGGAIALVGTKQLDIDLGNLTQRTFWFKPADNKAEHLVPTPSSTGGLNVQ